MCFYKSVLLPQHLVAIVQSAGNIQPRDRLKCQAADILHNTFHVSSSAQKKFILGTYFPEIFSGGQVAKSLNISEKQKLISDLLVVSASIVVLAFGSNGQVSLSFHFPFLNFLSFQVFATSAIRGIRFLQVRMGGS